MGAMNRVISAIVPSRLIIAIGPFLVMVIFVTSLVNIDYKILVLGILALAFADSSASALNSITDIGADRFNKPKRVLAKNPKYVKEIALVAILFFIMSLLLALQLSFYILLIIIARMFFEILYSVFRLKKVFLVNHVLVGITYGAVPLLLGYLLFNPTTTQIPWVVYLFVLLTIVLAPLKDIEDYYGDKKTSTKTLVVCLGLPLSKIILPLTFIIITFMVLILSFLTNQVNLVLASVISLCYLSFLSILTWKKIDSVEHKKDMFWVFTPFATFSGVLIELIFVVFMII